MRRMMLLLSGMLFVGSVPVWAQAVGSDGLDWDWQASFVTGVLTGGRINKTPMLVRTASGRTEEVPVRADTDDGWLVGIRLSGEQEYFGLEWDLSWAFQNMDLKSVPDVTLPSVSDATWFLTSINAMVFPTGTDWLDGRVRPFLTAGPGIAYLNSDFDESDSEFAFDANAGFGVKFLLGDEGNPVLRFEYRWHYMTSNSSGLEGTMYRQELTAGIGIRF